MKPSIEVIIGTEDSRVSEIAREVIKRSFNYDVVPKVGYTVVVAKTYADVTRLLSRQELNYPYQLLVPFPTYIGGLDIRGPEDWRFNPSIALLDTILQVTKSVPHIPRTVFVGGSEEEDEKDILFRALKLLAQQYPSLSVLGGAKSIAFSPDHTTQAIRETIARHSS